MRCFNFLSKLTTLNSQLFIITLLAILLLLLGTNIGESKTKVSIEISRWIYPGTTANIPITFRSDSSNSLTGGFDLLVHYDKYVFLNPHVIPGELLGRCGWEYFEFTVDTINALIRIVAVAEISSNNTHPSCFLNSSGELAVIQFQTKLESEFLCRYYPVDWYWMDCGDNSFSSVSGDSLFISNDVYSYNGYTIISKDDTFPTTFGAPLECDSIDVQNQLHREVDFYNGGVEFICSDITDLTGDVNLNGVPNEIADGVLLGNYLIYGESVFSLNKYSQARASDVNRDGVPVTLDDYVYLWRIVTGDALPIESSPDIKLEDTAFVIQDNDNMTLNLTYIDSLVAAYFIFDGEILPDTTGNPFQFGLYFDTVQTKVLLVSVDASYDFTNFGSGELFNYSGDGVLVKVAVSSDGLTLIPTNLPLAYDSTIFCCIHRGNVDGISNGTDIVNIADLTFLVSYVFGHPNSSEPICVEEANLDGGYSLAEAVNILDLIFMVDYLFKNGPAPAPCP